MFPIELSCIPTIISPTLFLLGLVRLEPNVFQDFTLTRQFHGAGRKLVNAQDVRKNIGSLIPIELSGRVGRHGGADAVKQVSHGEAVPVRHELAARQRRSHLTAVQGQAVAVSALFAVSGFASLGLLGGVDSIPDRARRLRGGNEHKNRGRRESLSNGSFILPKADYTQCTHPSKRRR